MKEKNTASITWTWADQISSYRFWGLLLFYILSIGVYSSLYPVIINYFYNSNFGIQIYDNNLFSVVRPVGVLIGFLLAWIAIKTKRLVALYFCSVIGLVSLAVSFFIIDHLPVGTIINITTIVMNIIAIISIAILIIVPSIIAGGRRDSQMFVISFGILILYNSLSLAGFGALSAFSIQWIKEYIIYTPTQLFLLLAAPLVLSIILLIPVKSELFSGAPPERGRTLPPKKREPILVVLMALVFPAVYFLYWLYRMHAEIRFLNNTPKLLSPRASVWISLFVPLIGPIIFAALNDCLNESPEFSKEKFKRPTAHVILWSIFFYPIGMAMIQANLNRCIEK